VKFLTQAAEHGRTLRDDLRVIAEQFGRQDIFFHAGSVAYSALLAAVPFLLLLGSALGFVLGRAPTASNETLARFLGEFLPESTAAAAVPLVRDILTGVQAKHTSLGLIGAPLFAWFSTQFFGALRSSLQSVFNVERGRGIIKGKLYDLASVLIGAVLVTTYIGLSGYVGFATNITAAIGNAFGIKPDGIGFLKLLVAGFISTVFLAVIFTSMYKFLPTRRVGWRSAMWGGAWGAFLFEITRTVIFQLVARVSNPASLASGTLAAIVIVLFWTYYAAAIFLIGGVVARVHEVRGVRRKSGAAPVRY
jgi:membrane protein